MSVLMSGYRPTQYNNGLASPLPSPGTPEFKHISPRQRSPVQLPPMQATQYSHNGLIPGRSRHHTPPAGYLHHRHQVQTPPSESLQSSSHTQTRSCKYAQPSLLEKLPFEVQAMIYRHLPYQQLIHLSTMNHYFHDAVKPTAIAHPDDMFSFVIRAAKDFKQHRPIVEGSTQNPGNFECYVCYTVRGPDHFDVMQPTSVFVDSTGRVVRDREAQCKMGDREIMLRRFCIECGVKTGLHGPGDSLKTKAGRELWVCRCQRVWVKPDCIKCPGCLADCPLRPRKDR